MNLDISLSCGLTLEETTVSLIISQLLKCFLVVHSSISKSLTYYVGFFLLADDGGTLRSCAHSDSKVKCDVRMASFT